METAEFLGGVDLFKHSDERALNYLANSMRLPTIPAGIIIKEDEPTPGRYIVKSGAAGVTKAAESGVAEAMLATLGEGNSFGEIGLIDGLAASASISAMQPYGMLLLTQRRLSCRAGPAP